MGILTQRLDEVRNDPGWLNRGDNDDADTTSSGVRVNHRSALGLTTVWRCVDLLSSAVSQAPRDVIVKVGGKSFPEFNPPAWVSTPNPLDPTYTGNDYFSQVAMSMLFDGNYFVHVYPYVLDPQVLTVLDPAKVKVRPGPLYDLMDDAGHVVKTLGPLEILHGTWVRLPGMLRGISPLETLRRGMGSAIAAEEHASRFFSQGAAMSFGVEVPGALDDPQKSNLRESLRKRYAGLSNSHAIGVLTGGAKFVTGLAPTPEQAQMLATRKFSVEDLCRPFGVPPGMAGSQEPGASSYASAEVHDKQFAERAVLPLAVRIEQQHNRLLSVPPNLAGSGAKVQFKFNLDHIARMNLLGRYQAYGEAIRGGFMAPNEARVLEDQPPQDGGDNLFMQVQMAPLSAIVKAQDQAQMQANPRPIIAARSEPDGVPS